MSECHGRLSKGAIHSRHSPVCLVPSIHHHHHRHHHHLLWVALRLTRVANSRPGILVLINDADWELEGEEAYELQNGDSILFVSTLHGG